MRVWRAAPDEAPAVAALLGGFRDHFGGDWPDEGSLLASVERIIARDDAEYFLAASAEEPQPWRSIARSDSGPARRAARTF